MVSFDLKEAAEFLKIHPETMRQLAISKKIDGAKIGRRWVFLEQALVSYITQQYSTNGGLRLVVDNTKEHAKWQSTNEKTTKATATTSTSLHQMGSEYASLLGLKTNNKRKNCTIN